MNSEQNDINNNTVDSNTKPVVDETAKDSINTIAHSVSPIQNIEDTITIQSPIQNDSFSHEEIASVRKENTTQNSDDKKKIIIIVIIAIVLVILIVVLSLTVGKSSNLNNSEINSTAIYYKVE